MNCEEFELLLADELGGELADSDRAAFETHLASCANCRREHGSLEGAVGRLHSLPAAPSVRVERMGDRLILTSLVPVRGIRPVNWSRGLLRYAAGIALAFLAGYLVHGVTLSSGTGAVLPSLVTSAVSPGRDLQSAVAMQFSKNPGRSDLAKGLLAVYQSR